MKKILVTGSKGFLGRHVLQHLVYRFGANSVYASTNEEASLPQVNFIEARFLKSNKQKILDFIKDAEINAIVNCMGTLGNSAVNNGGDLEGAAVLSCILTALPNPTHLVHIGSASEVSAKLLPKAERTPYSQRKIEITDIFLRGNACASAAHEVSVILIENLIGFGMNRNTILGRLYNEVVERSADNIIFGDLSSERDYVDVRDVAAVIASVCDHRSTVASSDRLLIGTGNSLRVRDLIHIIQARCSKNFNFVEEVGREPASNPDVVRSVDLDLLKKQFLWEPQYSIGESVGYFLDEHQNH